MAALNQIQFSHDSVHYSFDFKKRATEWSKGKELKMITCSRSLFPSRLYTHKLRALARGNICKWTSMWLALCLFSLL